MLGAGWEHMDAHTTHSSSLEQHAQATVTHPHATCVPTSWCWWEATQRGFHGLWFPVLTQEFLSSDLVSVVQRWLFHSSRQEIHVGEGAATSPLLLLSLRAAVSPWAHRAHAVAPSCAPSLGPYWGRLQGQRSDPKGFINSLNSSGESLSLTEGCANSNAAAKGSGIIFRSS